MSEEVNEFTMRAGGQEWECNKDNTSLFTFAGKTVIRGMEVPAEQLDHVFRAEEENDDGTITGMYVFRSNPGFLALANFLIQNNFPAHLNIRQVAECDKDAWEQSNFKDLTDYIPDEFFGDGDAA